MHRNHLVEYYAKEETLPPMIEQQVPRDRRHDASYERFMASRIQELNNLEQSGMEDSFPFPIEPFRNAPVAFPQKRFSNTSSDSGVNSPHILSPTMPIALENLQPSLVPSMSRAHPPISPLTPIQQFIKSSRKSKAQGPKYNRCQPDYPDPQSVLRALTRQSYRL